MDTTTPDLSASTLHALLKAQDTDEIYGIILDAILTSLAADGCAIACGTDEGLEITDAVGELYLGTPQPKHLTYFSLQHGVYRTGQPCLIGDLTDTRSTSQDTQSNQSPDRRTNRSLLSVPLSDLGVVFAVATTPHAFSQSDQEWLSDLAEYASSALERVRDETAPSESESTSLETVPAQIEYALKATDSYVWAINLDTDEVTTLVGQIEQFFGSLQTEIDDIWTIFTHLVHPNDRSQAEDVYSQLQHGEIETFEIEHRTPPTHDDVHWVRVSGQVQTDTGTRQAVGLATDITDQKRRERELERQNERLDRFTSVASHDLRNPLNVASGRLELVREDCESEHLDDVENALQRMGALIDDLLTLAQEGEPVSETESVPLPALAKGCWRNVQTHDATLTVDTDLVVQADRSRLQQLFENLFRNAIEHGGGDVSITVGEGETGFYVEDDGPGIPAKDHERVFEYSYSTSAGGTGFGLSIVKEIVSAHGWDITITDGRDGGARFEITDISHVSPE